MVDLPDKALQIVADRARPDIVLGISAEGRTVGVLELFKGRDGHAEIGISVEDTFQGKGYGKALFFGWVGRGEQAWGAHSGSLFCQ